MYGVPCGVSVCCISIQANPYIIPFEIPYINLFTTLKRYAFVTKQGVFLLKTCNKTRGVFIGLGLEIFDFEFLFLHIS